MSDILLVFQTQKLESDYTRAAAIIDRAITMGNALSLPEIAAAIYANPFQLRTQNDCLVLEDDIRKAASNRNYQLREPGQEIEAIQSCIASLAQGVPNKRYNVETVIKRALKIRKPLKGDATHFVQLETRLRNVVFYYAVREGYRLSYSEEIRATITTAFTLQNLFLTPTQVINCVDQIFGKQPKDSRFSSGKYNVFGVARSLGYELGKDTKHGSTKPNSDERKIEAVIIRAIEVGDVLTKREIAIRALHLKRWGFETLPEAKQEALDSVVKRVANRHHYLPAKKSITEKIEELLSASYLAGREIGNSRLRDRVNASPEVDRRESLDLSRTEKLREFAECNMFNEWAKGTIGLIARALHKSPGRFSALEALLMMEMLDSVLSNFSHNSLFPAKIRKIGYQGYDPTVKSKLHRVFKNREKDGWELLPLAARCVFAHAKRDETGLLSWYRVQPVRHHLRPH